jgi:hypothetical protein
VPIPVRKICELTRADVAATPERTTIKIGNLPAPIPEALLPLFHQHLAAPGNHRTMNHDSTWLFPGTNAGQHITEQMLMKRLRSLGIDITAARNGALHDLIKEIDPASLADLLGYTPKTMNIHATRGNTDGDLPGDQTSTPTAESRPPSNIRPNVIPQISNGGLAGTPIAHCGMQFDCCPVLSTVGRFRHFPGALRIDCRISVQLAASTDHAGKGSRRELDRRLDRFTNAVLTAA